MKFKIDNYKKIAHAEIETSKITCLCGKGMAGKTSLLNAVGCLATADVLPFNKFMKKMTNLFVGANGPICTLETDGVKIEYPATTLEATKQDGFISKIAANFSDFVEMDKKERLNYMISLTNSVPTEEELSKELASINPGQLKNIIMETRAIGYDATSKKYAESATKLKGGWENTTGKNYGTKVSQNYMPDGFALDFDPTVAQAELAKKNKSLAELTKKQIVSESDYTKLEEQAGQLDQLGKKLSNIKAKIATKSTELKACEIESGISLECPECGKYVSYNSGKLLKLTGDTPSPVEPGKVDAIKEFLKNLGKDKTETEYKIGICLKAKDSIASCSKKQGDNSAAVNALITEIDAIEKKLAIHVTKTKADDFCTKIAVLNNVVAVLKPSGLRHKVLKRNLAKFNKGLKYFTDLAKWEIILFHDDGDIFVNGIPYHDALLSRSQKYRIKTIFKLLICTIDHSWLIIIDDLDILLKQERTELVKILLCQVLKDRKFLLSIAYGDKDDVPNFTGKIPGWRTYWIDNGTIT